MGVRRGKRARSLVNDGDRQCHEYGDGIWASAQRMVDRTIVVGPQIGAKPAIAARAKRSPDGQQRPSLRRLVQLSAARPSDEMAEASRADPLLVGINRFAATFLHPLGKHEFKALDEREDKRGTEGPDEPRPPSSENCSNSTGGGNGEDDGDERQRCPKQHNFVRPFLQRSPEPSARDALEPSKRNDRAQAEHDQVTEPWISPTDFDRAEAGRDRH